MALLHHVRTGRRIVARAALAALLLSSGACGGGERDFATADTAVLQRGADTGVAALPADSARGPLSPMGDSVPAMPAGPTFVLRVDSAAGDSAYRAAGCQSCHGARGEGVPGLGNALADSAWLHGDGSAAFVRRVTLEGIAEPKTTLRGMPAYASRLTLAQADRMASYVVSLWRPDLVVDALPDSAARPAADTTAAP